MYFTERDTDRNARFLGNQLRALIIASLSGVVVYETRRDNASSVSDNRVRDPTNEPPLSPRNLSLHHYVDFRKLLFLFSSISSLYLFPVLRIFNSIFEISISFGHFTFQNCKFLTTFSIFFHSSFIFFFCFAFKFHFHF